MYQCTACSCVCLRAVCGYLHVLCVFCMCCVWLFSVCGCPSWIELNEPIIETKNKRKTEVKGSCFNLKQSPALTHSGDMEKNEVYCLYGLMYILRAVMIMFVACTVWIRIDAYPKDDQNSFSRVLLVSDIVWYVTVVLVMFKISVGGRVDGAWRKSHWMIPSKGPSGSATYPPRLHRLAFLFAITWMFALGVLRVQWLIDVYGISSQTWLFYASAIGEFYVNILGMIVLLGHCARIRYFQYYCIPFVK